MRNHDAPPRDLTTLAAEIHSTAIDKGFWDKIITKEPLGHMQYGHKFIYAQDIDFMLAKLALVHSEVSETLEAMRKLHLQDTIGEELADIIIRVLDFYEGAVRAGWTTANLQGEVDKKMLKNAARPPLHGNLA